MSCEELSDSEKSILEQFKSKILDALQPHHTDTYLLRWLKARTWDLNGAEQMFRQHLEWREKYGVDGELKTWKPPEVLSLYVPYGITGHDKDGSPVAILNFAGLDGIGLFKSLDQDEIVKWCAKVGEELLAEAAKRNRRDVTVIIDMEGGNLLQYLWKPVIDFTIFGMKTYEANYPETLKDCYVINAPAIYTIAYNLAKSVLKPTTMSKIKVFKHDKAEWQTAIFQTIDPENLPKYYGGTIVDSNGNPRCPSLVKQGGKVPQRYYKSNRQFDPSKNYQMAVVKSGEKLSLEYFADNKKSILKWDFHLSNFDIRFSVSVKDKDGNCRPVIEERKIAAVGFDESGILECEPNIIYMVTFDNSYSMFRPKTLFYDICVISSAVDSRNEVKFERNGTVG